MAVTELSNIKNISESSNDIALSLLSWDIEVSSKSGKFDSDGLNPENNIISIGCSYYEFLTKQTYKFCITFIPVI